ncbi:MAG: signal recognition particle-docking protein FtsY [Maricaulaceae bacterium]
MSEDKKKKGGFLKRAFGLKSKEDKLAEAAAEKAAQQKLVDEQMAARMAAINAAALKSAREQDEAASGQSLADEEKLRVEAEEKAKAEAQALKDVEAAKRLAEEKKQIAAEAIRKAEAEKLAREKVEAERIAAEKKAEEERVKAEAKRKADEKIALEKAKKEKSERDAAALKAKQDAEAKAKEAAEKKRFEAEAKAKELSAAKAKADADAISKLQAEAKAAEDAATAAEARARAAERITAKSAAKNDAENDGGDGFMGRITSGLKKSTSRMSDQMSSMFKQRKLDEEALQDLEDILITSDLGIGPASKVTALLAKDKFDKQVTDMEIKIALADVISDILTPLEKPIILDTTKPQILLFVGVNGSGKTTTLGKMAKRYRDQGKSVMLAAGDTFRAAAVEQLTVWGERADAPVVSGKLGSDAAGLVFDAIDRAKQDNVDILMIDTAGRLQNRTELMDELSKVVRVIKKQDPTAPHHCILVLDATVGQNALSQTEVFKDTAGVTGLVMTKLDGTAKGGVLVSLSDKFGLPIHAIGIGERVEDLENFSAPVFAAALSGVADALIDTGS